MTPSILSGNRQAPPGATLKTPAELIPKVDNVPAIGHSGAFCANETDTNAGAAIRLQSLAKQACLTSVRLY